MDVLRSQIRRQRVKHIINSYGLDGDEVERFADYLEDLLQSYPMPAVELALVEVLVECWGKPPLLRGCAFLDLANLRLQRWKAEASVAAQVTPEQFQQVTGLDPSPVFGSSERPPSRPAKPVR